MPAIRLDKSSVSKSVKLDNGWLRAPATLTRTGVFDYRFSDGTMRRELRLPEEVFAADALESFDLVPLTDEHPGALDSKNTHAHAVGSVGKVRADTARGLVHAELLVTDGGAVEKVESGKQELSCGYYCDLEMAPGTWRDPATGREHKYDAIQRNIRGNHVALVSKGRAGPEARVRLDSADSAVLVSDSALSNGSPVDSPKKDVPHMDKVKITIDGVEYEVSPQVAQALAKERETGKALVETIKADAATKAAETVKQTARADAAEGQVKTLQGQLTEATDTKRFDAAVEARVALVGKAREVLGADAKLDGKSETEIRKLVIAKLDSSAQLDGKSDEYVSARFDAALALAPVNPATAEAAKRIAAGGGSPRQDSADPEAKFNAAVFGAWDRKA